MPELQGMVVNRHDRDRAGAAADRLCMLVSIEVPQYKMMPFPLSGMHSNFELVHSRFDFVLLSSIDILRTE